jgi:hypothetical protein
VSKLIKVEVRALDRGYLVRAEYEDGAKESAAHDPTNALRRVAEALGLTSGNSTTTRELEKEPRAQKRKGSPGL